MNDYDLFAHIEQKIDASKFDEVSTEGVSDLSTLVRSKLQLDKDIEDDMGESVGVIKTDEVFFERIVGLLPMFIP